MRHHITISPAAREGHYRVAGAAEIEATDTPIVAAALALHAAGAANSDTIRATGLDVTFVDMTIGSILKPRLKVLRSEIKRQFH